MPQTHAASPAPESIDIGVETGVATLSNVRLAAGRPIPGVAVPRRDTLHVWSGDLLNALAAAEFARVRVVTMIGHSGTGKTSTVQQWHALLRRPLAVVSCHPQMQARDLLGGMVLTAQGMVWRDAPLLDGARRGYAVLLDEGNTVDAGERVGLNALMEGYATVIPETGEVVEPHPDFRVFLTQNPKTTGYRGRRDQDLSAIERSMAIRVDYLDAKTEEKLVLNFALASYASLTGQAITQADQVEEMRTRAEKIVATANAVRQAYVGSDGASELPCSLSTRLACRWAALWTLGSFLGPSDQSPGHWALAKVFTGHQEAAVAEAIHVIADLHIGARAAHQSGT